jgi:hypothetical protein
MRSGVGLADGRTRVFESTGPSLPHTLRVFLIDRQGRIRNIYSSGTLDPRLILADIRTLILEGRNMSFQCASAGTSAVSDGFHRMNGGR